MEQSDQIKHQSTRVGVVLLVLSILLVGANLRAPITGLSPLIDNIRSDTGIGNASTGMLTTLPLIAFAVFALVAPRIAKRIGIERTLFAGLFIISLGLILRSFSPVWMLFTGTALAGIGIAMGNVLLPGLIKREFPEKVGMMTGAYAMTMNGMAALASGISIPLSEGLGLGWHGSLAVWVLLALAALIVWIPQLRLRVTPSIAIPERGKGLWSSGLAWKVTGFMGLQSLLYYIMITWLPTILQSQGFSESTSGWLLALTQLCSLPTSFLLPILAGRLAGQRLIVTMIAVCFALSFSGLLTGITWVSVISVLLFGLAGGGVFSLATMFFVLRTNTSQEAAELSGMAQFVGYLLAAVGPTLFGLIHDITSGWTVPLVLLLVVAALLWSVGMGAGKNVSINQRQES
ncbi:MFS transporter, CP family, cyanate transporter [Terribacillus halophilus]|uniref:MFS transporter, CP family, cyanate transporter n=1 Tax=Terribacillus halophilus TaxID=361279 RepID=A0A1G6T723_9BACI|nr:MFS transporter [Terribacillus halophilus]SDD24819.1 MFS transporter, CP family, cyanate transporter [Terribacillus halophilus]